MKKTLLRIVKGILFLLVTLGLWLFVRDTLVMKRDDGITSMKIYYEQKRNTIDVLFLGSSHSSYNIAADELWKQYGISFYQLWGSSQPMWSTYHFLIEALKTQNPKVIVLDVYGALMNEDYSDEARQATNTLGLNISTNMVRNIMVSSPKERWAELFLGLPVYHDRFSELAKDDFFYYPWSREKEYEKGSYAILGTHNNVNLVYQKDETRTPLYPKQQEYLNRIIELCGERSIPLVLLVTPTVNRREEQGMYNTIWDCSEAAGIPFINMNEMGSELLIEPADFSLDDSHLNLWGARKVGSWLANYLHSHYALADHRGEPGYEGYERYVMKKDAGCLRKLEDPKEAAEEILRNDYSVLLMRFGSAEHSSITFDRLLINAAVPSDSIVLYDGTTTRPLSQTGGQLSLFDTVVTVSFEETCFAVDQIIDPYWGEEGIAAAFYDNRHHAWIDAVWITEEEPDVLQHLTFRNEP